MLAEGGRSQHGDPGIIHGWDSRVRGGGEAGTIIKLPKE
jgi:hypothetical protein